MRPHASHDQRTQSAYIFGAICPAQRKNAGLVMLDLPCNIMTFGRRRWAYILLSVQARMSRFPTIPNMIALSIHHTEKIVIADITRADVSPFY